MSNSLAIAAVTATLSRVIDRGLDVLLPGAQVSTKPLDKARNGTTQNQVNVFLYQTMPSTAWRNMDIPGQVKPGERGHTPLALDLYYLLTAYGRNDDDIEGHQTLGLAMSILHDHTVLDRGEIELALNGSDLHNQVERVRIIPHPMGLEDLSKLWTTFQSEYRISAAYQVSVVLIESTRPTKAALPVLTRGPADQGVFSQPDLIPPFPTITEVITPNPDQPAFELGDDLILRGHNLAGDNLALLFKHARLTDTVRIDAVTGTDTELRATLPTDPNSMPAGFYTVLAEIGQNGPPERVTMTNEGAVSIALTVTSALPASITRNPNGRAVLELQCSPQVEPNQQVDLLLGDRQIEAQARQNPTRQVRFQIDNAPLGTFFIRLRIDGVDSLLIDYATTPPTFKTTHQVEITA